MIALKLLAGFILLIVGAEVLVRGASRIAAFIGISPLVIGLTVVAFGTSSPELAVSVISSLNGAPGIAVGNVVGSNIFNILFILGLSSILIPLVVVQQLIRLDVPIMIGASLLFFGFAWDGQVQVWEGLVLLLSGIAYTVFIIRNSRKENNKAVLKEYQEEYGQVKKPVPVWLSVVFVVAGLLLLVLGSRWLVDSSVAIAQNFGVSDMVIGLTIIAVGTSLPEVATSLIASVRGERDIAVGNVVGSNIFNIVYILSAAAIIGGGVPVEASALRFDFPVMTAVAVACLPIFFTGKRLDRWEGFVFLAYYLAYMAYILLSNLKHHTLDEFTTAMIWFVIPITVLTLVVVFVREFRKAKN